MEHPVYLHSGIGVRQIQVCIDHERELVQAALRVVVALDLSYVYVLDLVLVQQPQGFIDVRSGVDELDVSQSVLYRRPVSPLLGLVVVPANYSGKAGVYGNPRV